jgi:hypothetical protein
MTPTLALIAISGPSGGAWIAGTKSVTLLCGGMPWEKLY